MRPTRAIIISLAALIPFSLGMPVRADDGANGTDAPTLSITGEELKAHIEFLADDEREGREAGTPGGKAAAEYLAEHLSRFGIEPGSGESYFQEFGNGMRNVVGIVRGSDPRLRDQVVVIGAHYDHVGKGDPQAMRGRMGAGGEDNIWNGADDNASGTAGVLEIAQAVSLIPTPPKRTVVFIFFDAEEKGLLGSRHYRQQPLFPLEDTVAMLNLDMIGRGDGRTVLLYGASTGDGMAEIVAECNEEVDLAYGVQKEMMYNSDHAHFVQSKIPVLFFFTGLHSDYHRPGDHVDKIQPATMEKIARLNFLILQTVANRDDRLAFRAPPQRVRLGVFARADADAKGCRLQRIVPDSPAARAGLQQGDILLSIGEVRTPNRRALVDALWKVKLGQTVPAKIVRDGEEITLQVSFGPPRKMGWY